MKLAVFGTSGFAREVRDIAVLTGYDEIVFIGTSPQNSISGCPVVTEQEVVSLERERWMFTIGVGAPKTRKQIWGRYPGLKYVNLIHPAATFGFEQREELLKQTGNIVCAGVRMTNQIRAGSFCIFNLNSTVGHDCVIEGFVTISPGAGISGNVLLKEGAYLGANSCVIQGKSETEKMIVGCFATVGAGAVVTKNVPDHMIVKGIPAK
ncbi:MAG: hypothetical protein LKJ17_06905 [Oscillospiraceae bacterium]|nr:hypothetical protein [Oscillospiraceae bacterium]